VRTEKEDMQETGRKKEQRPTQTEAESTLPSVTGREGSAVEGKTHSYEFTPVCAVNCLSAPLAVSMIEGSFACMLPQSLDRSPSTVWAFVDSFE